MRMLRWTLVALILAALFTGVLLETPVLFAGSGEAEIARVRGYRIGAGMDPVFALSGGDTLLRLVSNAMVPAELVGNDAIYGMTVEVVRPNSPIEAWPIYLRSHRSGPRNQSEDVCFDAEGTPLADSRHVDISLTPPAPPGTLVRVHGLGNIPSLVRAWSWQPREGIARASRHLALDQEQRWRLGAPLGVLSWDHLADADRLRWTTAHFARLAASGQREQDYQSHDFFIREAIPRQKEEVLTPVHIASPMTWLVQGPTSVTLQVSGNPLTIPSQLTLRRVSDTDTLLQTWEMGPDAPTQQWVGTLPEGLHTLVLNSSVANDVNISMLLPGDALLPPMPNADPIEAPPSQVTLRASPVGPETEVVVDAELPNNTEVRTMEIEVWSTLPTDPQLTIVTQHSAQTHVDTLRPVLTANAYDVAVDSAGVETPLRGPTRLKLLLPLDATEVHVQSDQPALLRFRQPFNLSDQDPGPPALMRQVGIADGPAAQSWVRPLSPNTEVEIHVKARVEPVPLPPPPPMDWVAQSLTPLGMVQRFEALERITGEMTGHVLTEVRQAVVRLMAGSGQTHARWSFEVLNSDLLGTEIPFLLDGVMAGTLRPALSRGTVRLPPLSAGMHSIEAHAPEGIRLFVNLPPAAGESAPAYRARSVWRLSQPVQLNLNNNRRGPRALNIVVYDPSLGPRSDIIITATVDGGAPKRLMYGIYTRRTPARRQWPLPAATHPDMAVLVDGERERIGFPRTLILPLGDDLQPGAHTIRIEANRHLYMRFFVVTPPELLASQATLRWEPEFENE